MTISIHQSFNKLDFLTQRLIKSYDTKQIPTLFNHILDQLGRVIETMPKFEVFDAFTVTWRQNVLSILDNLALELSSYSPNKKINNLSQLITNKQKELAAIPELKLDKTNLKGKIDVKLAFICDIDSVDYNAAMAKKVKLCLEQGMPLITTRSLFKGTWNTRDNKLKDIAQLESSLLKNHAKWEIFHSNEFLIFLPPRGITPNELLRAYDLIADGSIKKIPVTEAFQTPQEPVELKHFFNLFVKNPQANKLIQLSGHGSNRFVGGLSNEHYLEFLKFADDQKCKGLVVTSCNSGGASSLLAIPNIDNAEEQSNRYSFPIIVRSIGDFVSMLNKAEQGVKQFFDELEAAQPQSISQLRMLLNTVEKGQSKRNVNLAKVYFPHSPGIANGFRPIGENQRGFSLTLAKTKQAQASNLSIEIGKPRSLHIHPLVVTAPVIAEQDELYLQSMIPGPGRHVLKSLKVAVDQPERYIKNTIDSYSHDRVRSLTVSKAFLIGKLESKKEALHEVIIYITPNRTIAAYKKGEAYYFTDGTRTDSITALQHALLAKEVEANTRPSAKAIQATSAGYETDSLFREAWRSQLFYSEGSLSKQWVERIENPITWRSWIKDNTLTWLDKAHLILFLEETKHHAKAKELYQSWKMVPNIKNFSGVPLIVLASKNQNTPFVKDLLAGHVNVNAANPIEDNKNALHYAIEAGNETLFNLLVENPYIEFPLMTAIPKYPDFLKKMLAKLYCDYDLGWCLKQSICEHDQDKIDFVLSVNQQPIINYGASKAAVEANDWNLIKKLHEKGSFSFGQTAVERHGLLYPACAYGSYDIFKFLLDHCEINEKDSQDLVLAALFSACPDKLRDLKLKGATFPTQFDTSDLEMLDIVFTRYEALNDDHTIEDLLSYGLKALEHYVLTRYLESKPGKLREWQLKGLIRTCALLQHLATKVTEPSYEATFKTLVEEGADLNAINEQTKESAFTTVIKNGKLDLVNYCLKNGALINPTDSNVKTPLQTAAELEQDPERKIFRHLVELGGWINDYSIGYAPIESIVKTGNLELINWCLNHQADATICSANLLKEAVKLNDNFTIFKWLIYAGAFIDKGSRYVIPLKEIIDKGGLEVLEWCSERGYSLAQPSVLEAAFKSQKQEIINRVIADIGRSNHSGGLLSLVNFLFNDKLDGQFVVVAYQSGGRKGLEALLNLRKDVIIDTTQKQKLWLSIIQNHDIETAKLLISPPRQLCAVDDIPMIQNYALQHNQQKILGLLTNNELKLSFDKIDRFTWSIVNEADNLDLLKFLVSKGLNIRENALLKDELLNEPKPKLLAFLLKNGVSARLHIMGSELFPLLNAVYREDIPIVKLLLEKGGAKADVLIKSCRTGKSPLDLAIEADNRELINLLTKE